MDIKTPRHRPVDGDEQDAFSKKARRLLVSKPGKWKAAKRASAKRLRSKIKKELNHSPVV